MAFMCAICVVTGCSKAVRFDIDFPDQLVVNASISTDSSARVTLTESNKSDGSLLFERFTEAKIFLSDGSREWMLDQFATLPKKYSLGYYYSDQVRIVPNQEYRLRVETPSYPKIQSVTKVPHQPVILNWNIANVNVAPFPPQDTRLGGILTADMKVVIKDHEAQKNYYILCLSYLSDYSRAPGSRTIKDSLNTKTINFRTEGIQEETASMLFEDCSIFTNKGFEGQENEIYMRINGALERKNGLPVFIMLHLWAVSEDCYKYVNSYNQQIKIRNDPFSEPQDLFSNINGGLGIMFGSSEVSQVIPIR